MSLQRRRQSSRPINKCRWISRIWVTRPVVVVRTKQKEKTPAAQVTKRWKLLNHDDLQYVPVNDTLSSWTNMCLHHPIRVRWPGDVHVSVPSATRRGCGQQLVRWQLQQRQRCLWNGGWVSLSATPGSGSPLTADALPQSDPRAAAARTFPVCHQWLRLQSGTDPSQGTATKMTLYCWLALQARFNLGMMCYCTALFLPFR